MSILTPSFGKLISIHPSILTTLSQTKILSKSLPYKLPPPPTCISPWFPPSLSPSPYQDVFQKMTSQPLISLFKGPLSHLQQCIGRTGFSGGAIGKEPACQCRNMRNMSSIPGPGRSGEGHGNPRQQHASIRKSKCSVNASHLFFYLKNVQRCHWYAHIPSFWPS